MNSKNRRPSLDFAQREAADRLRLPALPDALTVAQAATLLGDDKAARDRWGRLLRAAIAAGELPTVVEHVPGKSATPWYRDRRSLADTLRRPAQATPARDVVRVTLAALRAWLASIGADVPKWLPGDVEEVFTPDLPEPAEPEGMLTCEPETTRGPRERWDRLATAMDTARRAFQERAHHWPNARQLWATLKHKDATGAVIEVAEEEMTWLDEAGGYQTTDYRAFQKRLSRLKLKDQRPG